MATIAFVGPDGTGKTTITRRLAASGLLPFKYLYMGVNLDASNVSLPTVRLAAKLKRHLRRTPPGGVPANASGSPRRSAAEWAWSAARLGNHLVDEWYRQLVSWYYQARGFVVLYDRHFVFDFSPQIVAGMGASTDRRIHHWLVTHAYPRPHLVFFLDAPGDVLFARKGESTVVELERRRRAFALQGAHLPNFIRVDATRPLDEVYAEIVTHLSVYFDLPRAMPVPAYRPDRAADRPTSHTAGPTS